MATARQGLRRKRGGERHEWLEALGLEGRGGQPGFHQLCPQLRILRLERAETLEQFCLSRLARVSLRDGLACRRGGLRLGGFESLAHDVGRADRLHLRQPQLGARRRRVCCAQLLALFAERTHELAVLAVSALAAAVAVGAIAARAACALFALGATLRSEHLASSLPAAAAALAARATLRADWWRLERHTR